MEIQTKLPKKANYCEICQDNFARSYKIGDHLKREHKDIPIAKYRYLYGIRKESESKKSPKVYQIGEVLCGICGFSGKSLCSHITQFHKMGIKEYKTKYPSLKIVSDSVSDKLSEMTKGDKNPAYQHGGKYSPFCPTSINYDPTASSRANESRIKNGTNTTSLEYHLKKTGGDVDAAKKSLIKRQSTFSIEKCISKYGEIEGKKRWTARQEKWQKTLLSKPQEELIRINKAKINHTPYAVSKAEQEIVDKLIKAGFEVETQFTLSHYIYDIRIEKRIIEYNGSYWHCDPRFYSPEFLNPSTRKTSKETWDKDADKTKVAVDNGYQIMVVWECDYKSNPDKVIEQCLNFLKP